MIDETFWILEQRAVARVWIQNQLGVSQMFEYEICVLVRKHSVVTPAHDQNRSIDPSQDGIVWIRAGTPRNQRFRLRTGYGLTALFVEFWTVAMGVMALAAWISSIETSEMRLILPSACSSTKAPNWSASGTFGSMRWR